MASNTDIIKEFLVSLGFRIDEGGQRKFANTIAVQTVKLQELAKVLEEAAEKVVHFCAEAAEGMEKLYFASQRTKASAANIQAISFAAEQMGSSAEAAQSSLENIAKFIRSNPGGESLIRSWGVDTRDTNDKLRDTTDIMQDLGKAFAGMDEPQAIVRGELLGIDYKTMMALVHGMGQFTGEYKDMLSAVGLNSQDAAKSSHELMNQLRGLREMLEVFAIKAAALALPMLTKLATAFRELGMHVFAMVSKLLAWWDRLGNTTKTVIKVVGLAAAGFAALATGLAVLAGVVTTLMVAWTALNASFLLSPIGVVIGLVLALAVAVALLWDDYQTWKDGGDTLIDWKDWAPGIEAAFGGIKDLIGLLKELKALKQWYDRNVASKPAGVDNPNLTREQRNDLYRNDAFSYFTGGGSSADSGSPATGDTGKLFAGLEKKYKLPAGLLDSVWAAESNRGKDHRLSKAGAMGQFQFMPATAKQYGLKDPNDLGQSAEAAAHYLGDLLKMFGGNEEEMVAAYNYGPGNVKRHGLGDLPEETRNYIPKVLDPLRNPHGAEQMSSAAAGSSDDNSKQVTINQTNTTTVTGADDPTETAKVLGGVLANANQLLVRNTRALAY